MPHLGVLVERDGLVIELGPVEAADKTGVAKGVVLFLLLLTQVAEGVDDVHVQVEHEAAEGGAQVVVEHVVLHALEDELDGQILSVQAHVREEVELIAVVLEHVALVAALGTHQVL